MRYDIAAHNPETGECLKIYREVTRNQLAGLHVALEADHPGAEITSREHDPDDDLLYIPPRWRKGEKTVQSDPPADQEKTLLQILEWPTLELYELRDKVKDSSSMIVHVLGVPFNDVDLLNKIGAELAKRKGAKKKKKEN